MGAHDHLRLHFAFLDHHKVLLHLLNDRLFGQEEHLLLFLWLFFDHF